MMRLSGVVKSSSIINNKQLKKRTQTTKQKVG